MLILEHNVLSQGIPLWITLFRFDCHLLLCSVELKMQALCDDAFLTTVISHICSQWNSVFFTIWQCIWPHLLRRVAWFLSHRNDMIWLPVWKSHSLRISFKEKIVYYSLFLTESASDRGTPAEIAVITEQLFLEKYLSQWMHSDRRGISLTTGISGVYMHAERRVQSIMCRQKAKKIWRREADVTNLYLFSALYCLHGIKQLESILSTVVLMYKNHCW